MHRPSKAVLSYSNHLLLRQHTTYRCSALLQNVITPQNYYSSISTNIAVHQLSRGIHYSPHSQTSSPSSPSLLFLPRNFSSTSDKPKSSKSLRRLAAPFLQLCHPDKFASIETAQTVNLQAVQTLNELIDTCDSLCQTSSSDNSKNRRVLQSTYVIEFMVPSSHKSSHTHTMCTRREVSLSFRNGSWKYGDGDRLNTKQRRDLMRRARRNLRNLMQVAGIPCSSHDDDGDDEGDGEALEPKDGMYEEIWKEMGWTDRRNGGRRKAQQRWEDSQARFRKSIDWKARQEHMDRSIQRLQADYATDNLTTERRKRQIIADVISRIRFKQYDNHNHNPYEDDDDDGTITPLDQLIALRRISLLLTDHFDKMHIEFHGRTWETLIIVISNDPSNRLQMRKRRRRKLGGESGFKFSVTCPEYEEDEQEENVTSGEEARIVTATVPIDFLDEELLMEFERHLEDLYLVDDDILNFGF